MKKFYFLALAALVLSLASCGPKVIEKKFEKTNFATVTVEGSGKYGVKDVVSGREILPQSFDNIGYYYSGFFTAKDNTGVQLFDKDGKCVIPAQEQISAKEGYFEFTKGDTKGFYFIKEKSTVSGVYNKFEIDAAGNISFVKDGKYGDVPDSLKDGHYGGAKKMGHAIGYQYAHDFPGHYVVQQYLPDAIKDREYYRFGDNKTEQAALAYRQKIRSMDR